MKYKSVTTTLQMQAADCGAASLKMLLDSYGHHYTLENIRTTIGVGRDGSSVRDIMNGAERFGFSLEPIRGDLPDDLPPKLPAILWWNRNHFLVYEGIIKGKFIVNDPAMGRRRLSRGEFIQGFSGITLILGEASENRVIKPDDDNIKAWQIILSNLEIVLPATAVSVVTALAISIPAIFSAQLTSYFVDNILVRGEAKQAIQFLWLFFALAGISTILTSTTYQIANRAAYIGTIVKGYVIVRNLLQAAYTWVLSRQVEELAGRTRIASRMAINISYQSVSQLARLGTALIISFVILAINIWLGMIGIILLLALGLLTTWIDRISASENRAMAIEDGKQQSIALSSLISLEEIRAANLERLRFAQWAGYYTNFVNAQQSVSRKQNIGGLASNAAFYLANTSLIVMGPILIILKQISLGDFVAVQYLIGMVTSGIVELPSILRTYQDTMSPLERLRDLFESNTSSTSIRDDSSSLRSESLSIICQNVDFSYDLRHPIFKNLNLAHKLTPVTYIASPAGTGKTTFIQLAAGLLKPTNGSISYHADNQPIEADALTVTYIPSDPILFSGSILDNITILDHRIDRSRAATILKSICSHADADIPVNFEVSAGGKNLSNTSKQILLLARILASVDQIILVDSLTFNLPIACIKYFSDTIAKENRFVLTSSEIAGIDTRLTSTLELLK